MRDDCYCFHGWDDVCLPDRFCARTLYNPYNSCNCQCLFHYPHITPIYTIYNPRYHSSFHFLFHYPHITQYYPISQYIQKFSATSGRPLLFKAATFQLTAGSCEAPFSKSWAPAARHELFPLGTADHSKPQIPVSLQTSPYPFNPKPLRLGVPPNPKPMMWGPCSGL